MISSLLQWQLDAQSAYDKVQEKIPLEWRLPEHLLAPAWVYPEDHISDNMLLDVRDVPASCGILDKQELLITESDATEILAKVKAKEWTALAVATAFCKRAAVAQQLVRCCTELFFDAGLARARELDEIYEKTGELVGPLHGLPVSIKDQFDIIGERTSLGIVAWKDVVATEDSVLVKFLHKAGAVLYVKTNVPQSLMSADSVNPFFGRVLNPTDRSRTSGGSSGGEGALLALRGAPLGVGTDIGGSIRIPAVMCSGYSLKPSSGRVPLAGLRGCGAGAEFVAPIAGPMSSSLPSLELFMKTLASYSPHLEDSTVLPISWTPVELPKKLRIGILRHNGIVRAHPPMERAVREAAEKLTAAGHEVVEWDVADMHQRAVRLAYSAFFMDGGAIFGSAVKSSGEPVMPGSLVGKPEDALTRDEVIASYWEAIGLRSEHLKKWVAAGLDAVIAPGTSHVATKHGKFNDVSYTVAWNLLDYPGVVIPGGTVDVTLDQPTEDWLTYKPQDWYATPNGGPNNPEPHNLGDVRNHAAYTDAKDWEGLPIGIQVFTLPHHEEKALAIAAVVDALIKGE